MRGTRGVVSREDGLESHDAIRIGRLDTAQEGLVKISSVGAVPITTGYDTRVDASSVTVLLEMK